MILTMTIRDLSIMFKYNEKDKIRKQLLIFQKEVDKLDKWFNEYLDKYTNSVLMNAAYDSTIRQPFNEKWDEYVKNQEMVRACKYYLEKT